MMVFVIESCVELGGTAQIELVSLLLSVRDADTLTLYDRNAPRQEGGTNATL